MKYLEIYLLILITIHVKSVSPNSLSSNNLLKSYLSFLHVNRLKLKCAEDVIRQTVPCGSFIAVVDERNHSDPIIQHLSATDCYNFIKRSPETQNWLLRLNAYIILVKTVTELTVVFDKLSKDFGWTPGAKFLIDIQHLHNEDYLKVFQVMSRLNILDIHLITANQIDDVYVYTYDAFQNNSCGYVGMENVNINSCKDFPIFKVNKTELEKQLRNCPITVIAHENPPSVVFRTNTKFYQRGMRSRGIEQYMLRNIAKQENYKLDYTRLQRRGKFEKPSSDCNVSTLQGLSYYPLGIGIGGYILMKKGSDCYDFIWGYCYANFHVYTSVRDANNWKKVYQVFGSTTWLLIGLSYCLVCIISLSIYSIFVGKTDNKYLSLKIWGYLNNHSDGQLTKIHKLRIIIITWIWFSFFISNFYNTAFYGLLTAPDKKGLIVKPEKLFSSTLKPCISFKIRAWFKLMFNLTLSTQTEDECLFDETALEAVAENAELYTLISEPTYYKREYKYLDKQGHPELERWVFGTGDLVFSIAANRGFLLLEKFQRYAFYHFESGLLLKHTEDTYHQFLVTTEFNPFDLLDFKIHFIVLFLGYILSIIIFIVEINKSQK